MASVPLPLQYLEKPTTRAAIVEALPSHLTEKRIQSAAKTLLRQNSSLQNVNPQSFIGAVIQASSLGLDPTGALGHCYLLPFKNNKAKRTDVQLIIGYRGMIDLARRSGQIVSIEAHVVRTGDVFEYAFGLEPKLKHEPGGTPAAKVTHAYAVAHLVGGGVQWDVMTRSEIDAIRTRSKAGNSGPWTTDFDEMAKKTVIRRLFKYLPVSVEMQHAVGLDEKADANIDQNFASVLDGDFETVDPDAPAPEEPKKRKSTAAKAKEAISQAAAEIAKPPEPDRSESMQADLMAKLDEIGTIEELGEVLSAAEQLPEELAKAVQAKADDVADALAQAI